MNKTAGRNFRRPRRGEEENLRQTARPAITMRKRRIWGPVGAKGKGQIGTSRSGGSGVFLFVKISNGCDGRTPR